MMKDKSSAAGILESTIEKVKDLVNVSTLLVSQSRLKAE